MGHHPASYTSDAAEGGFGTGLLHRLAAHVLSGHDVVVITPLGGGPVMDLLSIALGARRCRVVQTTGLPGGGLEGLFKRDADHDGGQPSSMLDHLAVPGPGYDRVVLLVAQAHLLTRAEYALLASAAKAGPLQFVLAAPVDPVIHLDGELALFYNRVSAFSPLVIEPGTPLAVLVPTTPAPPVAPAPVAEKVTIYTPPLAPMAPPRGRASRARNGWIMAIAVSAVFSAMGAGLHFGWISAQSVTANAAPRVVVR